MASEKDIHQHLTISWDTYFETKPVLRGYTDDELLELLDHSIATLRAVNGEIERRACADRSWPSVIMQKANLIYRGYVPAVPDKPSGEEEDTISPGQKVPSVSIDLSDMPDF